MKLSKFVFMFNILFKKEGKGKKTIPSLSVKILTPFIYKDNNVIWFHLLRLSFVT